MEWKHGQRFQLLLMRVALYSSRDVQDSDLPDTGQLPDSFCRIPDSGRQFNYQYPTPLLLFVFTAKKAEQWMTSHPVGHTFTVCKYVKNIDTINFPWLYWLIFVDGSESSFFSNKSRFKSDPPLWIQIQIHVLQFQNLKTKVRGSGSRSKGVDQI